MKRKSTRKETFLHFEVFSDNNNSKNKNRNHMTKYTKYKVGQGLQTSF